MTDVQGSTAEGSELRVEMIVIKRLGIAGALTARRLGLALDVSTQQARRILQRVQAAGFIESTTDLEDTGEPGRPARLWRLR